jgi:hypothetical protein
LQLQRERLILNQIAEKKAAMPGILAALLVTLLLGCASPKPPAATPIAEPVRAADVRQVHRRHDTRASLSVQQRGRLADFTSMLGSDGGALQMVAGRQVRV